MSPRPKMFDANHDRAKRSTKHEHRIARELGGRRLPRSGGIAWSRSDSTTLGGDVNGKHVFVEHKRVEEATKSISIKRDWMAKVTEGARRAKKIPALAVTFEKASGFEQDWLMVPLPVAKRMLAALFDDEGDVDVGASRDPA